MPRNFIPRPSHYAPDTLPKPPAWQDEAACGGIDNSLFFSLAAIDIAQAKSHCGPCPVRSQCLTHALTVREDHGVWGGLDEFERAGLLKDVRRAAERQRRLEREREKAAEQRAADADAQSAEQEPVQGRPADATAAA
ncbi:WhiB family transcriptional regulator [Streptomyces vinaceus]|uniref:WhiB family transcriptional regulator n=1 Tax=Streptomyces vinaceus TaxID=1960 RepID=UPI0036C19BF5